MVWKGGIHMGMLTADRLGPDDDDGDEELVEYGDVCESLPPSPEDSDDSSPE
jgi:hypothetical protein